MQLAMIILLQVVLLWSCQDSKKAPPFPVDENEYQQPITKKFSFSEKDSLEWSVQDPGKFKKPQKKKFSWKNIPSQSLDIGEPFSLKKPIESESFSWDSLAVSDFNLDSLYQEKIQIEVAVLGAPKVVKAGSPVYMLESTRGVMTFDANFGSPGLPSDALMAKDGMIWMITNGGVVRYDSQYLEIYGLDQGFEIGYNPSIFEDSKGRIWVGTSSNSVILLDVNANLIYTLSYSFPSDRIFDFSEDNEGRIWFTNFGKGYNIIDLEKELIYKLDITSGLLGDFGIISIKDKNGLLWLASGRGINIIDLNEGLNYELTNEDGLIEGFVQSMDEDQEGRIWIGTDADVDDKGGVSIINKEKKSISHITSEHGLNVGERGVSDVFQDRSGKYWISTANADVYSYSEQRGELERFVIKNPQYYHITNLFEDNQGQIWMPSGHQGIHVLDPNGSRPGNFSLSDGLGSSSIWSLIETKEGQIWMGSRDGIDIFDPDKKSLKHLDVEHGLISEFNTRLKEDSKGRIWISSRTEGVDIIDPVNQEILTLTTEEGLETNSIMAVDQDKKGLFWMVGRTGEMLRFNEDNFEFSYLVKDSLVEDALHTAVIHDAENRIWTASQNNGIYIIDSEAQTGFSLTEDNGLISNRVYSLYMDSKNIVWASTHSGLVRIDTQKMELTTFSSDEGLGSDDIYAQIEVRGEMYVGSSNGLGIIKPIDAQGEEQPRWEVKNYGRKQGFALTDFAQEGFTLDRKGRFWASLVNYVTVLNEIQEDTVTSSAQITGINILDQKRNFLETKVDNLMFKVIDSLLNISQNENVDVSDASMLRDKGVLWKKVEGPYHIPVGLVLPHAENYLSFNFHGGQFANPDKLVYRYILEGIDKNWSPISGEAKSENYRDLSPGDYRFKVASKGFNGVWSKPAQLSFTILPPWWLTWWAKTILVILFLGLGLVILHYRSRWLKKENKILEDKVNERTSELKKTINELENTQSQLIQSEKMASLGELTAGIAHEIQNPMNFINNFSEVTTELVGEMCEELDKGDLEEAKDISKDIVQNMEKISHHGKRASSIVRGMLEHSRNNSGQKEFIDINVLADEYLRLAYHGLRAKDKSFNADFKTDLDETLPKVEIIPQDLGRVVLNIINNAFFAVTSIPEDERTEDYQPLVTVTTKNMGDQVLISIKDNGPGIPAEIKDKIFQPFFTTKPTGKGTGLGLSLAYDIVTTGHGGALELNTSPGEGTEFVIYIPMKTK